jgi:hypothetical protein
MRDQHLVAHRVEVEAVIREGAHMALAGVAHLPAREPLPAPVEGDDRENRAGAGRAPPRNTSR